MRLHAVALNRFHLHRLLLVSSCLSTLEPSRYADYADSQSRTKGLLNLRNLRNLRMIFPLLLKVLLVKVRYGNRACVDSVVRCLVFSALPFASLR
jgi:hypothetical protein